MNIDGKGPESEKCRQRLGVSQDTLRMRPGRGPVRRGLDSQMRLGARDHEADAAKAPWCRPWLTGVFDATVPRQHAEMEPRTASDVNTLPTLLRHVGHAL